MYIISSLTLTDGLVELFGTTILNLNHRRAMANPKSPFSAA